MDAVILTAANPNGALQELLVKCVVLHITNPNTPEYFTVSYRDNPKINDSRIKLRDLLILKSTALGKGAELLIGTNNPQFKRMVTVTLSLFLRLIQTDVQRDT